jgi:hypothetical protein
MSLKNQTQQGLAAQGSYLSAALVTSIGSSDGAPAQATFKHTGTAGYWYVTLNRSSGPTTTSYSLKLGPGEFFTEDNPPYGAIWALADANVDQGLSWYVGWTQ